MNLTLLTCTLTLGIGSEILQHILDNGRSFDIFDVLANAVGSLGAVGLCSWYHKRMLERRRNARFGTLADDGEGGTAVVHDDLELGIIGPQESGTTTAAGGNVGRPTLEEEVDNWDENEVDNWDDEDGDDIGATSGDGDGPKTPGSSSADGDLGDAKK